MEAIAAAVGERCGVRADALVAGEHACVHLKAAPAAPPSLARVLWEAAKRKRDAELRYHTEVLGKAPDDPAVPPPLPPAPVEAACGAFGTGCTACSAPMDNESVLLLPDWKPYCRRHARRRVFYEEPEAHYVSVTPRGGHSAAFCLQCEAAVEWRQTHPEIAVVPAPEGLKELVEGHDEAAGCCMRVAALAAEATSWHCLGAAAGPASWGAFLQQVAGVFMPPCGLDRVGGTSSPFSTALSDGLTTGFACVPNARIVGLGGSPDRNRGEEEGEGEAEPMGAVVWGKPSRSDQKCVFGFLLGVDEDSEDESDDAEEAEVGEGADAEAASPSLENAVLASKLQSIAALGVFDLRFRHVYDSMGEQWVTAAVPCVDGAGKPSLDSVDQFFAPASDMPEQTDANDGFPSSSGASSPQGELDSENASAWVRFFLTAHTIALGIVHVGHLMDEEEHRRK
ncbi:hypothetical protein DIPPA_30214 [Diplonema papillatum]|nr:hypothetical protein DIPPA_30214 [Diplonema papillatum]